MYVFPCLYFVNFLYIYAATNAEFITNDIDRMRNSNGCKALVADDIFICIIVNERFCILIIKKKRITEVCS